MSYKCLFEVSVKRRYMTQQLDVIIAFLYQFFDEVIYVKQFYLFELNPKLVCHLRKTLYGLKQAP